MCRNFLGGASATDKPPRPTTRIVIQKCEDCGRAWQQSRGRTVELREAELVRAECNAEVAHGEDGADRAKPTIPRRIRKQVWSRDRGRCRVPGCRATRNLDIHHIVHRADGGGHDPSNMIVLCSGHHMLHHEGLLSITGRAPDELSFARNGNPLADSRSASELAASFVVPRADKRSRLDDVVTLEHAKQALMQLGFKAGAARRALDEVRVHVGGEADVATLVQAVLARTRSSDDDRCADDFALAKQALLQLGYSAGIAAAAVEAARSDVGSGADLEAVIREALRRCA